MNKSTILTAAICAALALTGCTKDNAASSGSIRCNVRHSSLTKAVEANLAALKNTGFTMLGIIDEDAHDYGTDKDSLAGIYIDKKAVSWNGTNWSIAGSPKWVVNDSMRFWCWTPATGLSINPSNVSLIESRTLPFTYTMPAGGSKDASDHASDAKSQNDILFSYNSCMKTSVSDEDVIDFYFYHPLSNIRFCTTPTTGSQTSGDGTYKASYKIVSIALQNVSSSADCIMTGRRCISSPVAPTFTWSNHSGTTTYTQYYGAEFLDGGNVDCPEGWTESKGSTPYTANEGFFIIPQAIGESTSLAVTFDISGNTVTKSVKLKGQGTRNRRVAARQILHLQHRHLYRIYRGHSYSDSDFYGDSRHSVVTTSPGQR